MPKRKRSSEKEDITKILSASHHAIHDALKIAQRYERQRYSKRQRDPETDAGKRARLQNEILILKSLNLQQVALTHLRATLLRINTFAECERLPAQVRTVVEKPDITEEEFKALHNVTSCLCARVEVRKATDKAIEDVAKALGVKVPEKKKGRVREKRDKEKDDHEVVEQKEPKKEEAVVTKEKEEPERKSDEEKRKRESVTNGAEEDSESEVDEIAGDVVEKMEDILGSSSEAESDDDGEDWAAITAKIKAQLKGATLAKEEFDPMEITSGEEERKDDMDYDLDSEGDSEDNEVLQSGEESDSDNASESGSFQGFSDSASEQTASDAESGSDSESSAIHSPPRKKKAAAPISRPDTSAFLPSLMGGYISDSNSEASDLDIAPNSRKNRRGQRARQAIWEKRYKDQAKHLREGGNKASGRDAGWDMKRGAIDPDSAGKPWKIGIKNPLLEKDGKKEGEAEGGNNGGRTLLNRKKGGKPSSDRPLNRKERRALGIKTPVGPPGGGNGGGGGGGGSKPPAGMPPKKRDDQGPLHPSWEARKKAKEKLQTAPFQGKKITFD